MLQRLKAAWKALRGEYDDEEEVMDMLVLATYHLKAMNEQPDVIRSEIMLRAEELEREDRVDE